MKTLNLDNFRKKLHELKINVFELLLIFHNEVLFSRVVLENKLAAYCQLSKLRQVSVKGSHLKFWRVNLSFQVTPFSGQCLRSLRSKKLKNEQYLLKRGSF